MMIFSALMTYGFNNHAVRSERWRYIQYADGSEELYDHDKDPNEWKNLVGDPRFADIIAGHKKHIPTLTASVKGDLKLTRRNKAIGAGD